MNRLRLTLAAMAAVAVSACAPLGPQTISVGRPLYNEAVQQTEAQQLLLNIVRQRYNDPILFLDVTSISSGSTRSVNANVLSKIITGGGRDEYSEGIGATYGETPIIFYSPNNGEKFVRQMLTPLDLRTITLILQAGWSVERVLMVTGDALNDIRNTTPAPPAPGEAPAVTDFQSLAAALRDLQRRGDVNVGVAPSGKDAVVNVTLLFSAAAKASPSYQKICRELAVPCDGQAITLRQGVAGSTANGSAATLATRSLFSSIFYLAQGVEVPAADAARGVVENTRLATNESLFRVRTSQTEPRNTAVKVFYRGSWFYIPDTDADSKVTFGLMSMLLTLQAGDTNKITPLVTLPAM